MNDEQKINEALRRVKYPNFDKDILTLGLVKEVRIDKGAAIVIFSAMAADDRIKDLLRESVTKELTGVAGITAVEVGFETPAPSEDGEHQGLPPKREIPGVAYVIPVASGKGGVGKSTVAVNLAAALSHKGLKVGLLDLDIYGPSIPLMLGLKQMPRITPDNKIYPLDKFNMRLMSIGFLLEQDTALIWRGPMVMKAVDQFLYEVRWGQLDYLIIDLPPGTGDAQLTLVQSVPITAAIVVTTPQDVALLDAKKAVIMFEKTGTPLLGIVENMSYFVCPHCHNQSNIFGHGGGKRYSDQLSVPFLGEIPIQLDVRESGDNGTPIVLAGGNSEVKMAFESIADQVIQKVELENLDRQALAGNLY